MHLRLGLFFGANTGPTVEEALMKGKMSRNIDIMIIIEKRSIFPLITVSEENYR